MIPLPWLRSSWTTLALSILATTGCNPRKDGGAHDEARVTLRSGNTVKFKLGAEFARSYGIEATPAKAASWQPKIHVDGRVIPNPHASFEVRAPVAGVLLADTSVPLRLGTAVKVGQLARFEGRFTAPEKLDLQGKLVDAEARLVSTETILKIRQDAYDRIKAASTNVSQANLDERAVQLAEAKMAHQAAQAQRNLWKDAFDSVGKQNVLVSIQTPMAGEIAELIVQPGTFVESGSPLLRIVDYRRVLVRLDFPATETEAPREVELEAPTGNGGCKAILRGPAPNVEVGLQRVGYLYETEAIPPNGPTWRPGLYVRAVLPESGKSPLAAAAIPASALLVHQGRTLVYVQLNPGRYERRVLEVLGRQEETLYVLGVRDGEEVVSKHAQVLLSEEFRSDVDDD
jgi:multidrug efflux pump subunit AcrA (membrane-fusion protein)